MTESTALDDLAAREVVELHMFFQSWMRPGEPPDFGRCEAALAAGFRQVGPDGIARDRDTVLARIRAARCSQAAGFTLGIEAIRPVWRAGDAILLEYVETQYGQGRMTRRQSTALLCRAPSAPNGVVWRHLQETWLRAAE